MLLDRSEVPTHTERVSFELCFRVEFFYFRVSAYSELTL
jgi:hypothetical protein